MPSAEFWWVTLLAVATVSAAQWWIVRAWHRRDIAALRARHVSAQQSAATLLQQARQQTALAQRELAAAQLAAKRVPRPEPVRPAPAKAVAVVPTRAQLDRMLDDATSARAAPPANGFADTMPSRQFGHSTSFGLLQRTSSAAA